MASRSDIKEVIDAWQEWLHQTRETLIPREQSIPIPEKLALAIIGARRSGKSFAAASNLLNRKEDAFYMNFEDPFFIGNNRVEILDQLISVFTEHTGKTPRLLLFDEIQNISGWERWVRKMVDLKKFRLVLTGSSALMLSSEIATSLTGRCLTSIVWPLSFREYRTFAKKTCRTTDEHLACLRSYMMEGGFPEVALTPSPEEKTRLLKQYLTDILYKDIIKRHEIRTPRYLEQLVSYYLTNISCSHSYNSVRKAFGLNVETAREYTHALQDAFLIFEVNRYHPNLKVQARDSKKIYAIDTGLRNSNVFSPSDDLGKLAENIVYLELRRRGEEIWYFNNRGEVDFFVTRSGKPKGALQVCYDDLEDKATWERETSSLVECLEETKLDQGTLTTLKREETIRIQKKEIHFVPLYKWLKE